MCLASSGVHNIFFFLLGLAVSEPQCSESTTLTLVLTLALALATAPKFRCPPKFSLLPFTPPGPSPRPLHRPIHPSFSFFPAHVRGRPKLYALYHTVHFPPPPRLRRQTATQAYRVYQRPLVLKQVVGDGSFQCGEGGEASRCHPSWLDPCTNTAIHARPGDEIDGFLAGIRGC